MGERQNGPFELCFNTSLKVDFQGSRVTSDGGLILVRELDERLGFGDLIVQNPTDNCVQQWSGVYYQPGRKPIIEIPVRWSGPYQNRNSS